MNLACASTCFFLPPAGVFTFPCKCTKPLPSLDGGHVLFLIAEVITGRKPSDKFLMYAQTVGMMLLMTLMVYATWNDIMRIFVK